MSAFAAPTQDLAFALKVSARLEEIAGLPGCEAAEAELVAAVLEEAGRFAAGVLAPLNAAGDRDGARLANGVVVTTPGWQAAYAAFRQAGWNGVPFDPAYGGQGLPWAVQTALQELWTAANMAFSLCPLLTQGAIEALHTHADERLKALYLPPLIDGRWTGTMNLTEPQAGTDLALLRSRAVPEGDHFRITGQKIFITYGDHDLAENIVHLVLARLPDAPPGTKGISLFAVPKLIPDAAGRPGRRNDLRAVSLEHKLGIHGSPTAVMAFGEEGGAIGHLVGPANGGLECMFTMMNNARLAVGVQGVGIAERAWQQARDYARTRLQGRDPAGAPGPAPIIRHGDVRRMLLAMRARTQAARGLALHAAGQIDRARRHPEDAARAAAQARVDLLTPVVKAWCTDLGVEVASIGIQVHGGMGYIEETGAAQHYRDARIAPIYEGTNGIQAMDLVGRKLARDGGSAMTALIAEMRADPATDAALAAAIDRLEQATQAVLEGWAADPRLPAAAAAPYLELTGTVTGGWQLARQAAAAPEGPFGIAKRATSRFYAEQVLSRADSLLAAVRGAATVWDIPEEAL
ncbi:MAG: acyl-CoA dehydrogenase [Thalassobaculales bacterium]